MITKRLTHVLGKAWGYFVRVLEEPSQIGLIARNVAMRGAHVGEVLNAVKHERWLTRAEIGTVIDVGAHKGEFASGIKSVLPNALLYAFEPQPDCHAVLAERVKKYPGVETRCLALGKHIGISEFHRNAFSKSSSLLAMSDLHRAAYPWTAREEHTSVRVSTLDNELGSLDLPGKILLKIDVQGYELEVLKGAAKLLERVDYVLVETSVGGRLYEGEATFEEVSTHLARLGFSYAGNWDQMANPLDGRTLQVDALFVRQPR
jgi:FkbM family methyltransferase